MAKTAHLPGMEPPSITEIDDAAEEYVSARNSRMKLSLKEKETNDRLMTLMKKHKLNRYEYGEKIVQIVPSELKCKVRKKADEKPKKKRRKKDKDEAAVSNGKKDRSDSDL